MTLDELRKYKPQIEAIAAKYGVTNIRVFGSVVRGEARADSDVDLLVTYNDAHVPLTLFDIMELHEEIQQVIHREVELVDDAHLHPYIGPNILREAVSL